MHMHMSDLPPPNQALFLRCCILDMTQAELADALGLDQSTISRHEARGRLPGDHWDTIRDLARKADAPWSDSYLFPSSIPDVCPVHGSECTVISTPRKHLGGEAA